MSVRVSGAIPIALAALAMSASCARSTNQSSSVTILYPGDEHVFSLQWDEDAKFLVFLPLVTRNAQGELEGRLARSWEHSPDYHTWTIHLRSDVRWNDGVPVTAADIKFTLELMSRPDVGWLSPRALSVTVRDDSTYVLTLHQGTTGSPLDDWTVYYPKHLLERLDPAKWAEWEFWLSPVGDGPYRYLRRVPKTMLELAANPDYYRGRPRINRVVLRFGPSLITELLSGNVDAIPFFNKIDLLKLAGDPRFEAYHSIASVPMWAMLWNLHHPAFGDPRVRRALTLAIDRPELLRALNYPPATPIFDVMFSEGQLRRGEVPAPLPHDPAEARRLLVEAGWAEVGDNGIRHRRGEPFRFVALVSPGPFQGTERGAIIIQAQLRTAGVQMEIQSLEFSVALRRVRAGEFDAMLFNGMPIQGWAARFFGPNSPTGYVSVQVAALLQRARDAVNPDDVDRAYRALAPIFQADLPVTFLAPSVLTTVAHRRLRGLSSPWRISPVQYMDELWLENGR